MGFTRWDGTSPAVPAEVWRPLQHSDRLEDIRRRHLLRRDQGGCPIVHEGYVIGWVPTNNLKAEELDKLLSALTAAIAQGHQTVADMKRPQKGT